MEAGQGLLEILKAFGFPVFSAIAVGFAFYRALRWLGEKVVLPFFARFLSHIDTLEKSLDEQTVKLHSIKTGIDQLNFHVRKNSGFFPPGDSSSKGPVASVMVGVLLLLFGCPASAELPYSPANAIVRIKSHGCSATVIASREGKSWLLGCCHMFLDGRDGIDQNLISKPLKIDGPPQPNAPAKLAGSRVLGYDKGLDLSLLELDNGPFYSVPVAPAGHKPSSNLQSFGYDTMKWPMTVKPASIVQVAGQWLYTREKPWHGRSGGALIDVSHGYLIGVVHGYESMPQGRGIYVSHAAVVSFIEKHWPGQNLRSAGEMRPRLAPLSQGYEPKRVLPRAGC